MSQTTKRRASLAALALGRRVPEVVELLTQPHESQLLTRFDRRRLDRRQLTRGELATGVGKRRFAQCDLVAQLLVGLLHRRRRARRIELATSTTSPTMGTTHSSTPSPEVGGLRRIDVP